MVQKALKWVAGGPRRSPAAVRRPPQRSAAGAAGGCCAWPRTALHPFLRPILPRSTSRSRVLTTYARRPTSILVLRLGWRFAAGSDGRPRPRPRPRHPLARGHRRARRRAVLRIIYRRLTARHHCGGSSQKVRLRPPHSPTSPRASG